MPTPGRTSTSLPAAFVAPHDRVLSPVEQAALRGRRATLLARARGRVLDLGGGAGEHLRSYPGTVERVDVVGPDPLLAPILQRRVKGARVPVRVLDGGIAAVEGPYDTVVVQLVACAVRDVGALLDRLRSLLEPERGLLLFFEHVPLRPGRSVLTSAARPVWRQLAAGCDLTRDLPTELRRHGFAIIDIERFTMTTLQLPIRGCVAGAARHRRIEAGEAVR